MKPADGICTDTGRAGSRAFDRPGLAWGSVWCARRPLREPEKHCPRGGARQVFPTSYAAGPKSGLIGGGTVGGGYGNTLSRKWIPHGLVWVSALEVAGIVVRNPGKSGPLQPISDRDWRSLVARSETQVVVGIDPVAPRRHARSRLRRSGWGKPVVTANKALLSATG